MHFPNLVDGVDAVTVPTRHALQVAVPDRLDGRNALQQGLLVLGESHEFRHALSLRQHAALKLGDVLLEGDDLIA